VCFSNDDFVLGQRKADFVSLNLKRGKAALNLGDVFLTRPRILF
jgi:hypothetical protein